MNSITEEMYFRQRLCEYAIKYGVTKAARKYHTNRQFVCDELKLIQRIFKRNGRYGMAEVYVRCKLKGYTRSFGSMCKQIRKFKYKEVTKKSKSFTRYNKRVFRSEKELREEIRKHEKRYNNAAKVCLKFKSPNKIVKEFRL